MRLNRVTITGADDNTEIQSLIDTSRLFPYVEWGVLVSERTLAEGNRRFPSIDWVHEFLREASSNNMMVSAHLCGKHIRDLLRGNDVITAPLIGFQRIQLNFHDEKCSWDPKNFVTVLKKHPAIQWVFQIDRTKGWSYFSTAMDAGVDCAPLFDTSGGLGLLPHEVDDKKDTWPQPPSFYHGYAGGLSPENVAEQIAIIESREQGVEYWIDVETNVRSLSDEFDLDRVRLFLEECRRFLKSPMDPRIS